MGDKMSEQERGGGFLSLFPFTLCCLMMEYDLHQTLCVPLPVCVPGASAVLSALFSGVRALTERWYGLGQPGPDWIR